MKTIPVCDLDSLKDGEMSVTLIADAISRRHTHVSFRALIRLCRKEVEFGNGKVLLSRIGEKVHATSAYCTHYGAPLAKGVLVADGRVVWCVDQIALSVYASN